VSFRRVIKEVSDEFGKLFGFVYQHIRKRLNSFLADLRKGLVKKLWKEFTGREFIREQEVTLKKRINRLLEGTNVKP